MSGYVVFDLDGCVSDDRHRRHLLPSGYGNDGAGNFTDADFEAYHESMMEDEPLEPGVDILRRFFANPDVCVLFVTARPEAYFPQTLSWIRQHFGALAVFGLLMRPDGDRSSSPELKVRLLKKFLKENHWELSDIKSFYDDRWDVLAAYANWANEDGVRTQDLCVLNASGNTVFSPSVRQLDEEEPVSPAPSEETPADILETMADTFRERNEIYGNNYLNVSAVMKGMFPDGVPEGLPLLPHWHLFELIIVKLTRFANSNLTHTDSIHDAGVYAAMIENELTKSNGEEND